MLPSPLHLLCRGGWAFSFCPPLELLEQLTTKLLTRLNFVNLISGYSLPRSLIILKYHFIISFWRLMLSFYESTCLKSCHYTANLIKTNNIQFLKLRKIEIKQILWPYLNESIHIKNACLVIWFKKIRFQITSLLIWTDITQNKSHILDFCSEITRGAATKVKFQPRF